MGLNKYLDNVGVSRSFFLSRIISNEWRIIFLIGVRTNPLKDVKYILVEYNSFLKSPINMKVFLVMIYIHK